MLEQRLAAVERLHGFIERGDVIQGAWRGTRDGRETACLLAALHPVTRAADCPAWLMPPWCAELLPAIDDGVAAGDVLTVARGLYDRAPIWARLDDAGWERVRVRFLVGVIDEALNNAWPKGEPPAYWAQVENACQAVQDALQGRGDLQAAARASWAAWAAEEAAEAAEAAWAAEAAAEAMSAAWAAARAAARAAMSAARAAWAAARAEAMSAAWAAARAAAAWLRIAHILFAAMDAEQEGRRMEAQWQNII